jgi:hypothetical protein
VSQIARARPGKILIQSTMLAVTDIFRLMAFLCFAGLPLLVLFKRYDPRHVRAAVH